MCCLKKWKLVWKKKLEKQEKKIIQAIFIIEFIQTIAALYLGIKGIVNWNKFSKSDFEKNGYYFFKKGVNQSTVNINSCTIFDSFQAIDYFQNIYIKNKYLVTLQFWFSLVILFIFQLIDLITASKKRKNDPKMEQILSFLDLGGFRFLIKYFLCLNICVR